MENFMENTVKAKLFRHYERYMLAMGMIGQVLYFAQAVKIFYTQAAKDVSLLGFTLGFVSVSSWLVYGILIKNRPLVFANIVAVIGALLVLVGILMYGNK
jgi:MtN3 and saliva related transmembrane protein